MDVPYSFILIAFTHSNNFTGLRKLKENELIDKNTGKQITFYDTFDIELRLFIEDIVKLISK